MCSNLFYALMGFGAWTTYIDNRIDNYIDNVSDHISISARAPADILFEKSAIDSTKIAMWQMTNCLDEIPTRKWKSYHVTDSDSGM